MTRGHRQVFLIIFLFVIAVNVIEGIQSSFSTGRWGMALFLLAVAVTAVWVAYRSRDAFSKAREQYRRRFEETEDNVRMRDAALFSLSWSKEIYKGIPEDRKRLVKQAFILIGSGMAVTWMALGNDGFVTVLLIVVLVLAGVNLLVWVFGSEREERDRLRVELDAAGRMQMQLMPSAAPELPGFDIAGCCVPAKDVGGDHFDYVKLGGGENWAIAVADVAGKGMDAAMPAVFTSGAFASEARRDSDISGIMHAMNSAIRARNDRSRFVSFLLAAIEPNSRKARIINAGQPRPLLCRGGEVHTIENAGPHFPLGLVENADYEQAVIELIPGDLLLLSTDGLTEAMNPGKEMFGDERLREVLPEHSAAFSSAASIVEALRGRVDAFSSGAERHDDLTIVVVRVTG